MENLDRGVVAMRTSDTEAYVSWRYLGTDATGASFNLYRSTGGATAVQLNSAPITGGTNFVDTGVDLAQANAYFVRAVVGGAELGASPAYVLPAASPVLPYLRIPLQIPAGVITPDLVTCTYSANDCSVGDLDGDGELEIIVKWDPSNSRDNASAGYSGNVYLDAYKLNGTRLWRIDLGVNIRAGAHYTQFMVYDLDGDGRAEIACRTAEGSKDGTGAFVAAPAKFVGPLPPIDHAADRRNTAGYILSGPEFLTVFDGNTGAEKLSTNYNPPRYPGTLTPTVDQINAVWGDNYGNRIDRFLACVAYLDGRRPSLVMCRGYYTRAVIVAYDFRDGALTQRWIFDTNPNGGAAGPYGNYAGQGNHNLTVADVDGDGRDEIVYGSCTIDDDGRGLYSTGLGHGDALHVADMDPTRPGLEVWAAHENGASTGVGHSYRDARTGEILFTAASTNDAGRAMAGDIDPAHPGYELWGARGSLYNVSGAAIGAIKPSMNFGIWWDGDLQRELLDGTTISQWDPATATAVSLVSPPGVASNNSTKATPCLSADILGDWREEVIWREADSSALRIYVSTTPTLHRIFTLMHDRQYRESIAWQNVAYNQPPYPSFYLGEGMATPAQPAIVTSLAELPAVMPAVVSINRYDPATEGTAAATVTFRVTFTVPVTGVDAADFIATKTGTVAGVVTTVAVQSPTTYDVSVGTVSGSGLLRLDLAASGTNIMDTAGTSIAGGFTTGQAYKCAPLAWINPATGGRWSDPANWDFGAIADGLGAVANFGRLDLTADNTVVLDTPRTLSGLTFADTDTATAGSWTVSDGGSAVNVLTLDVISGSPTVTVNALGTGNTVTLGAALAGTKGLAKAGVGTLQLTGASTLTGALAVNAGTLRLGTGSSLALTSAVSIASAATGSPSPILNIAGGTFSTSGLVTVNAGTVGAQLIVDGGVASFTGGLSNSKNDGASIRINGGTVTAASITLQRGSYTTIPSYGTGFIVTGGTTTVTGGIGLGTSNSSSAMSIEGGALTVNGVITVGNQTSGSRGGAMRVINGTFTSTESNYGIVLAKTNAANPANVAYATFAGGTSTVEKITFGYDSTVTGGSGTLLLSAGEFYLGSGGLVQKATGTYAANISLTGGALGAKANWATTLPMAVENTALTIKAADAAGTAHDITLGGALTGTGSFTKTGGGTLTLAGTSTNTGSITVDAGTLNLTGTLAAGGSLTVNAGAALVGNGMIGKSVTLATGSTLAPFGTISGTTATWNPGAMLAFDVGPGGDLAVLSGALTKGTTGAGPYVVYVTPLAGAAPMTPYTLATFASTDFVPADFVAAGLPPGSRGACLVTPTSIAIVYFGFGADAAFNEWLYANGVPAGQRGAADDPDADGVPNLLEFVLGTGPLTATPLNVVPFTLEESGLIYPAIQYNRRRDLGGVGIEVRADVEPACAANHGVVEVSAADRGDGIDAVIVRSLVPLAVQPRQFMRVFATLP